MSKTMKAVAMALGLTSLAALASHTIVVGDTEWTCQHQCIVQHHADGGGYDIFDRGGGWIYFVIR